MAKIHEVASLANVSIATVSRVTSGLNVVDPETRQRVLTAMNELNYVPNGMARNLRNNRSGIIVAIMVDMKNSFFTDFIRGMGDAAQKAGYHLLIADADGDTERENEYLEMLEDKTAEGMILTTARIDQFISRDIKKYRKPIVVAFDQIERGDIPSVFVDNINAARKVVNHLHALGHRRIAFISGSRIRLDFHMRFTGYKQTMQEFGIMHDELLIHSEGSTLESGFNMTNKLLDLENVPSAIFAANDQLAIGAMKAILDRGLKIPEDLAVVGFGDLQMASYVRPALTTIHQPRYEIGKQSAELLIQKIKNVAIEQPKVLLEDSLIIRESCGYLKKENSKR